MTILTKQVKSLGFSGNGMYQQSLYHTHYFKKDRKAKTVTVISNLTPQIVSVFKLSAKDFSDFDKGKIGITPPNCVNVTRRRTLSDCEIIFQGAIKNKWHLKRILGGKENDHLQSEKTI